MKLKVLKESKDKNTYKIYYISKSTDLTTSAIIHAYSEKQAELLLRKVSNDIYHIIRIECIEDHSNDDNDGDGKQLSMFDDM